MDYWLETQFIYHVTTVTFDRALERLFELVAGVLDAFWLPIQAAAAIYIILMGYSLMSGLISLSAREVAVRFAKVIGIILLVKLFHGWGDTIFEKVWGIPEGIADFFTEAIVPIIDLPSSAGLDTLDSFATFYTGLASVLSEQVSQDHAENAKWGFGTWFMAMAPFALTVIAIYIAKFISALLFLASPLVFILSLTLGSVRGNNILMSWLKAVVLTFITLIFIYIVGVTCIAMIARYMAALIAYDLSLGPLSSVIPAVAEGPRFTLLHLSPLGILALFSIIMISQATSVASSIMGIAAINTQQATSFMQIGALQAASRAG